MNSKSSTIFEQEITAKAKWLFCLGLVIFYFIPYTIVNHLPLHRYTIPFILGEELIPYLPWTFFIYVSSYIQALIVIRYMPGPFLKKTVIVLGSTVIVSLLMFIFIPIRFPRELYMSDSKLVKFFQILDTAGNCFPSLHVITTTVFAFCYSLLRKPNLQKALMWLWTALITFSVLTTKQHYLVDIFGGLALAVPTMVILKRYAGSSPIDLDKTLEK